MVEKQQREMKETLCEECKVKASKYKCPGCSLRSCSLPCVKAHKKRTGCSGKRNLTQFVPLSQFNDNLLVSDYNFLEETKRVAESAQRMRAKLRAYPQFRLPAYLYGLRRAAASRRTKLMFLPSGMSKREKNQSRYDQRKKFISWTIEWRFHTTDVVLLDHGIHEDRNIYSVVEQHLKPGPWNHQLRQFCEENLESLKFFIRKYPKGPKSPFYELDIKAPLKHQLANRFILEYPVIHVFLPSCNYDFEVVKCSQPSAHRLEAKKFDHVDQCVPVGVSFREEEIEEINGSSEPQVFDFMKNEILCPLHETSLDKMSEKPLDASNGSFLTSLAAGSNSNSLEPVMFEDMDFDFDLGLMDAYSDLIGQFNPDDFFDLEGEFPNEAKENERIDLSMSRTTPLLREEVEEGEIVE